MPRTVSLASYNLSKIAKIREVILEKVCTQYYGSVMAGELLVQFAGDLCLALGPGVQLAPVWSSCRNLAGRELTVAAAGEVAWRLAGNLPLLSSDLPVLPWIRQTKQEWVPLEVIRACKRKQVFKAGEKTAHLADASGWVRRYGVEVKLRILAGSPAGLSTIKFWSSEYCEMIKAAFGFDKYNRERHRTFVSTRLDYPLLDSREFFGLLIVGLIDPEQCKPPDEIGFSEFSHTATTKKINKALMRLRLRDDYDCPLGYTSEQLECHDCSLGRNECPASCHSSSFKLGYCPKCKREDVWLDPEDDEVCIACAATSA